MTTSPTTTGTRYPEKEEKKEGEEEKEEDLEWYTTENTGQMPDELLGYSTTASIKHKLKRVPSHNEEFKTMKAEMEGLKEDNADLLRRYRESRNKVQYLEKRLDKLIETRRSGDVEEY